MEIRLQFPTGHVPGLQEYQPLKQITIRALNYSSVSLGRSTQSVVITNNSSTPLFTLTSGDSYNIKLIGIRFNDGTGTKTNMVYLNGSGTKIPIIEDCYFEVNPNRFGAADAVAAVQAASLGGLIYNSQFIGVGTVTDVAMGQSLFVGSPRAWNTASTMGAADTNGNQNFYVEDCYIKNSGNNTFPDCDHRGRFVLRYSTIDGTAGGIHGFTSAPNEGRHVEFYNNTYTVTTTNRNLAGKYFWIRAGTGVWTDNVVNCGNTGYGNNTLVVAIWRGVEDTHNRIKLVGGIMAARL